MEIYECILLLLLLTRFHNSYYDTFCSHSKGSHYIKITKYVQNNYPNNLLSISPSPSVTVMHPFTVPTYTPLTNEALL